MRVTWVVLGALVVAGAVAYLELRGRADEARETPALDRQAAVMADRPAPLIPDELPGGVKAAPRPSPAAPSPKEAAAQALVQQIEGARATGDAALEDRVFAQLRAQAWDTHAARRHAVRRGFERLQAAERLQGAARVRTQDEARRLLSRGVLLPELFDATGAPVPQRAQLLTAIQRLNAQVLTWSAGVEGVTRPYEVPPGKSPVQIVTDERLTCGHNALLMWNKRGNLDPRRLVAGETLLLPLEPLWVHVSLERRLLTLFLGDAWVKEFRVGVGAPDTPTPPGTYTVGDKQENPDWYVPQGGLIRAGDPRNELGSAWINLLLDGGRTTYGIHGTNKPDTVGTACSQGCVRLSNADASEVFWWVRTGRNGGQPTRVVIE
jgi:hypothetical protein